MARKKAINKFTAQELYELARERERQEQEEEREAARAQIEELTEQRRALIAEHRKELAAIDREISQLGGRPRRSRSASKDGGKDGGKISDQVVQAIASTKRVNTRDLKSLLEERGIATRNLNQMLAYLKRSGRVVSPGRGVYAVAK